MKRKKIDFKKILGRNRLLIVYLVIFIVILLYGIKVAIAYHTSNFKKVNEHVIENQRQIVSSVGISSSPAPYGWQLYTNQQLGFSLYYPGTWQEIDMSKSQSFEGACFGVFPEGTPKERPYSIVQFCVDLKPYVRLEPGGFGRNDSQTHQKFFGNLDNIETGQTLKSGDSQYTITKKYKIGDAPAIERIETVNSSFEGTEPVYTISVYVNDSEKGLIRLSMHGRTLENFKLHENTLRTILESFLLLK